MSTISPTIEGFRAAFRRPSVTSGEIVWRWSVGATATALLFFGFFEYLNTLPVTSGEMLLLRTRQPYLVAQAIAHILHGSLNRAVMSLMLAVFLMGVLWIIAASVGRIATVGALISYFRDKFASAPDSGDGAGRDVAGNVSTRAFPALVRLNCLRGAAALAAIAGFVGAAILAGFASPAKDPQPELAFFLFLPLALLIWLAWWFLNWFLSLAGVLVVRDRHDAMNAMVQAITFCQDHRGAVFAVSTWSGLAHLVAFGAATTVVSVPLGLAGIVPWQFVASAVILATLVYLAVVDWLYVARMAGYLCIAEMPEAVLASPPAPVAPTPLQNTIDRDEPILSDVPGLIIET